jgi:hypothetical protein
MSDGQSRSNATLYYIIGGLVIIVLIVGWFIYGRDSGDTADMMPAEEPAMESTAPAEEPATQPAPAEEPAMEEAAPAEEPVMEEETPAEEPAN